MDGFFDVLVKEGWYFYFLFFYCGCKAGVGFVGNSFVTISGCFFSSFFFFVGGRGGLSFFFFCIVLFSCLFLLFWEVIFDVVLPFMRGSSVPHVHPDFLFRRDCVLKSPPTSPPPPHHPAKPCRRTNINHGWTTYINRVWLTSSHAPLNMRVLWAAPVSAHLCLTALSWKIGDRSPTTTLTFFRWLHVYQELVILTRGGKTKQNKK